jgi:hypothetical protein
MAQQIKITHTSNADMNIGIPKNLTAVDWLVNEYFGGLENCTPWFIKHIEQAKQMEKEQIINAYVKGFDISAEGWNGEYGIKDFNNIKEEISAEQYYNETYNK